MKKKVVYVIIAALFILNIKMVFDLNNINRRINMVNDSVQGLNMSINNIQSSVSNTVQQMYEEKKWLYDIDYNITDISKDLKEAALTLKWSLRDLNKNYKVYLLYAAVDEKSGQMSKWNEAAAEDLGNLNYKSQLNLPYQNNYQFKVVAKDDNGIVSEKLIDINFLSDLNNRLTINVNPSYKGFSNNHVNLSFSVDVSNRCNLNLKKDTSNIDEDLLKMKNINIRVYSNGALKKEIKLLEDGQLLDKNAHYDEPFKFEKDVKLERISYNSNIEYDSTADSIEEIEVIVEDYIGKTYTVKSHGI